MLIGYARVSSLDQNPDLQWDALTAAGCTIYGEKKSGARSDRQALRDALAALRPGDTFVVWKLDRLGRSMKGLVDFILELRERQVNFRCLTQAIDTSTTEGRLLFHVTAAFAEAERDLIRERTMAGLAAARARGRVGGRPEKLSAESFAHAQVLLEAGTPKSAVASSLKVSLSTLERALKRAAASAENAREQAAPNLER